MVEVTITLQRKCQAWYVLVYEATFADGTPPITAVPDTRKFITQTAAVNHVKRMVLACLQNRCQHATGMDITCHVHVRISEDIQRRA